MPGEPGPDRRQQRQTLRLRRELLFGLGTVGALIYREVEKNSSELLPQAHAKDMGAADINRQVLALLDRCAQAQIPPPLPLVDLIRRQLDVRRTQPARNMDAWWSAIQIEAQYDVPEDQSYPSDPSNGPPSVAALNYLETTVGCDRKVIREWRKKLEYHRDVEAQRISNALDESDPETEKGDAPVAWFRDDNDLDRFVNDQASNDADKKPGR